MAVKKICVLSLNNVGVPLSATIAFICPEIRVTVVKTSYEEVFLWNSGQIPPRAYTPGLEEYLRKCQNKNLFFTTNERLAIKDADVVFIASESELKTRGEGEDRLVDFSKLEDAALLICQHSESSKIVVENSFLPLRATECIMNVFKYNVKPGISFQVLSSPEFYIQGGPLRHLLSPSCVMIGSEATPEGLAAAKQLFLIYNRWMGPEIIIQRSRWWSELSKICASAILAQFLGSLYAMAAIYEETGGDLQFLIAMLSKTRGTGYLLQDLKRNSGKFSRAIHNLIDICDRYELREVADYWREVFAMKSLYQERFCQTFIWALNESSNRKIALLGYSMCRDSILEAGSEGADLCKFFLGERALVRVHDPKLTHAQVIDDLISAGCDLPKESLSKSVTFHEDPYKAAQQSQAIVVCGIWPEFASLDFHRIFAQMVKPAYVFDRGLNLPHLDLLKIGFKVHAFGKRIKNTL